MGDQLSRYHEALAYLFARTTGGSRYGLQRTEALLRALGDPHRQMPILHIAGTNGKGSVCATLSSLLRARGLRVAKYTSPHLVDFRERFVVAGVPIAEEYVVDFIERWTPTVEEIGATFFEATTALAFDWFAASGVDVAVVEAGLGGRLDSTNVVAPLLAAVTSIGIDHTEYLGTTREEIAREKGGIFKPGAAAAIGEPDEGIRRLLADVARERGASRVLSVWDDSPPFHVVVEPAGTRFTLVADGREQDLRMPLPGEHQASNAALALLMLRALGGRYWGGWEEAALALETVRLPGRFHQVPPWIFDVAHNPDGARVLADTLAFVDAPRPVVAVLCVLGDKDWGGIMEALSPAVSHFVLTNAPSAPVSRAWSLQEAHDFAASHGWRATAEPDFDRALDAGRTLGATVLVTGSFHTVGDAMARLQVDPLAG